MHTKLPFNEITHPALGLYFSPTEREDIVRAVNRHDDLVTAVKSLLEWVDAVPQDTMLPTMPGVDRDWLEQILDKAQS